MSQRGIDDLKKHEGVRTVAYADPYYGWSMPTICYGSTKGVKRGQTASLAECDTRLREDVAQACQTVYRDIKHLGIQLTQGEQDAYCSFAYNTGYFRYQRNGQPTGMYRNLVAGNRLAACGYLNQYIYSNGVKSRGLATRRLQEHTLCIQDLT